MANNNTQDTQNQNQQGNPQDQQNQLQPINQQQNELNAFERIKKYALDKNGNYDGSNLPNKDLPGMTGIDLVNISIREIDKKIEQSIRAGTLTIESFEEYQKKYKDKELDKDVIKHLYFNDVLSNVFSICDSNSQIYFQTKNDYKTFAKYLQDKTIQIITAKNVNGFVNQPDKYINLKVKENSCIEGDKNNGYCSSAAIANKATFTQTYVDYKSTNEKPFGAIINCSFNTNNGFCYSGVYNTKNVDEIHELGTKYKKKNKTKNWLIFFLVIASILCIAAAVLAGLFGKWWQDKKKKEEEAKQQAEEEKKAEALDDRINFRDTQGAQIKYAQGTNVNRTGKNSKGNKVNEVVDVNDIKYGKDMEVNGQLKDATELAASGEVKKIIADGKSYDVLNIDVTKGTDGAADTYKLTLSDRTTKTFNQDQISSVKIGNESKEYVGCLDTMENVDVQRSGNNTYFYYNTNDLEANLSTNNPTVTAYDANGAAMISTNATSEAGLSMLQQIYDDNPGCQYNARLNTLLGQNWYDKNGYLHDYKTGNLVDNYKDSDKQLTLITYKTEKTKDSTGKEVEQQVVDVDIAKNIDDYYSGLEQRNSADHTNYKATEKYNDFTANYGSNYANKIENSGFSLYDNITTNNSVNTAASYNLTSTYKDRTNCLFA